MSRSKLRLRIAQTSHRPDHCDGALAIGKLAIPTGMRLNDAQVAARQRTSRVLHAAVFLLKVRWPTRSQR